MHSNTLLVSITSISVISTLIMYGANIVHLFGNNNVVNREFVFCLYSGIYILVALFSGGLVRSLYCCAACHFGGQSESILYGTHLCFPWLARCAHLVRSIESAAIDAVSLIVMQGAGLSGLSLCL